MINEPMMSSGQLTVATTVVISAPALLGAVVLNPGSAASSITVYDNASAGSGTILASLLGVANGASITLPLDFPIYTTRGLTVVVAGTAATGYVCYSRMT